MLHHNVTSPARRQWLAPALAMQLVGLLALLPAGAQAAFINYQATNVAGDSWRYEYTVTNDGSLTAQIRVFDILFDPALYDESSLAAASSPALAATWDERFLGSGLLISAAYDVAALSGGIATGATQGGFAVQFRWLGTGTPGPQAFEIYSPDTFALLGSGTTSLVPLPATLWLLGSGVAGLAWRRRGRARR